MTGLPDGWRRVVLGEIADTALGKMLDKGKSKGHPHVPYLRNVNVQWGRIDTDDLLTMELANDERERFGVRKGDLLVCEGGEVGRAAIWERDGDYIAYQKALHRVRPHDDVDGRYLQYALEYAARTGVLDPFTTGSTIAHLPQQSLRRVPIAVPGVDEQRRIVEILEDYLSRLDAAQRSLGYAEVRTLSLTESLLASSPELATATEVPLGSVLASPLVNGRSVPTAEAGFPVLRLTAMKGGVIDLAERKTGRWTAGEASRFRVEHGDVFVSRGNGSLSLVGRAARVVEGPDPIAFPDTMIRMRLDESRARPDFLTLVWNARRTRSQIERTARTTAGIYKVNQKDLQRIVVPLPPPEEQARMVDRLDEQLEATTRTRIQVATVQQRGRHLRSALLTAAFSGRLTGSSSDAERIEELVEAGA